MDRFVPGVKSHRQTMGTVTIRSWPRNREVRPFRQLSRVFTRLIHIMRASHGRIEIAAACCALEFVLSVPGFAQSNDQHRMVVAFERTAVGALRQYTPEPSAAALSSLPSNFIPSSGYQQLIESMLERSPTFRRQCRRIASTSDLVITLRQGASRTGRLRAMTRIVRQEGRVLASIEIFSLEEHAELIAHELEHVIEQLDGVDLASKAARTASGVYQADGNAFETTRAVRMGQAVAAEMRQPRG
jgi:hypothetical protein